MRQLIDSRWFALADLLVVVMSAGAWMLIPRLGIGFSLIALLPWVLRSLAGRFPFQRTPFDWLIAIFVLTAWIGYWAAYDKSAAWVKIWLIVGAVLLYYALSAQPKQNFILLSFLSFCFALALSFHFSLTFDFTGIGGRLAIWWMNHRPHVDGPGLPLGYVSGLVLINSVLALTWLWKIRNNDAGAVAGVIPRILLVGMGLVTLVFVLKLSHGIEYIGLGAVGLWALWRVSALARSDVRVRAAFPFLVLSYVVALIAFAYLRPTVSIPSSVQSDYGADSRAELLGRAAYFLLDYPITGAGLASFPGLYSQYILVIPHIYLTNSYNLFLDVAIEQGVTAGLVFIILYAGGVYLVSQAIVHNAPNEMLLIRWLGLCALIVMIVHGISYDILYNGSGTALLFYPLGMAMLGVVNRSSFARPAFQPPKIALPGYGGVLGPPLVLIAVLALNMNKILPLWYANLGAIQMSRAELKDFPTGHWGTSEITPRLNSAEATLRYALQHEPHNQTANYRLGLILMQRQDYEAAVAKLETAYRAAPNHRGIVKNLGYCYVWLGDMEKALTLLEQIPETQHEMKVYIWWLGTQGRPDLSARASLMLSHLETASQ